MLLCAAIAFAGGLGCIPPVDPPPAPATAPAPVNRHEGPGRVYDAVNGYSFKLPEGYHQEKTQWHLATYLAPWEPEFTTNLNIDTFPSDSTPVEQAGPKARRILNFLLRNYRCLDEGVWTIDSQPCYYCSGTFEWEGRGCRNLQVFLRGRSGRIYVFTFATTREEYERHRAVFEATAKTIRVD